MRWSEYFVPTRREVPEEAEIPSHVLMIRAGLIRMLHAGHYIYLPLGYRALRRAERIVREEMDRAGAIEIHMPALHERELWEKTGRVEAYGPVLFQLTDRHGKKNVLGPTHEEIVTNLVAHEIQTYRQLPVNLYQIQTKFRDEERPRFGVLRTREFLMKDAYSFDADDASLERSYQAMYEAYHRIFDRCGLKYIVCEAEAGAIGGGVNHEFMVPSAYGEDRVALCNSCGYSANLERCECAAPPPTDNRSLDGAPERVHTPGRKTIEDVSTFLEVKPRDLVKTLIYKDEQGAFAVLVRGDHEANEAKIARARGRAVETADAETVERVTGAAVGFAGPVGLDLPIYADALVAARRGGAVTGANQDDHHLTGVAFGRDYEAEVRDLRVARDKDPCPRCDGGKLKVTPCIEVGHVFKLGRKYSEALEATYTAEDGSERTITMGCYGIGLNRILVAAVEQGNDEGGIIWPPGIAPFDVALLCLNPTDAGAVKAADEVYGALTDAGLEVLYDERDERAGVKFNDADLIGLPVRVVVGGRSLKEGRVEVHPRAAGRDKSATQRVAVDEAVAAVQKMIEERSAVRAADAP